MGEPSIYNQLAKESLSDLTVTQLNSGSSVTTVDRATINYWKGPITLSRILQSSRTYAHGLEIPETGAIESIGVDAGDDNTLQPTGSEIWRVKAIYAVAVGGTATVTIAYTDGTLVVPIKVGASVAMSGTIFDLNESTSVPFTISNPLYLQFYETGSTNAVNFFVVYYKVSL